MDSSAADLQTIKSLQTNSRALIDERRSLIRRLVDATYSGYGTPEEVQRYKLQLSDISQQINQMESRLDRFAQTHPDESVKGAASTALRETFPTNPAGIPADASDPGAIAAAKQDFNRFYSNRKAIENQLTNSAHNPSYGIETLQADASALDRIDNDAKAQMQMLQKHLAGGGTPVQERLAASDTVATSSSDNTNRQLENSDHSPVLVETSNNAGEVKVNTGLSESAATPSAEGSTEPVKNKKLSEIEVRGRITDVMRAKGIALDQGRVDELTKAAMSAQESGNFSHFTDSNGIRISVVSNGQGVVDFMPKAVNQDGGARLILDDSAKSGDVPGIVAQGLRGTQNIGIMVDAGFLKEPKTIGGVTNERMAGVAQRIGFTPNPNNPGHISADFTDLQKNVFSEKSIRLENRLSGSLPDASQPGKPRLTLTEADLEDLKPKASLAASEAPASPKVAGISQSDVHGAISDVKSRLSSLESHLNHSPTTKQSVNDDLTRFTRDQSAKLDDIANRLHGGAIDVQQAMHQVQAIGDAHYDLSRGVAPLINDINDAEASARRMAADPEFYGNRASATMDEANNLKQIISRKVRNTTDELGHRLSLIPDQLPQTAGDSAMTTSEASVAGTASETTMPDNSQSADKRPVRYRDAQGNLSKGWKVEGLDRSPEGLVYQLSRENPDGTISKVSASSSQVGWEASPEQQLKKLRGVYEVGPSKPLGYIDRHSVITELDTSEATITKDLESRGLKVFKTEPTSEMARDRGFIFAYDEKSLGEVLQKNSDVLTKAGWPTDPKEYAQRVATIHAPEELHGVVADAFGERSGAINGPLSESPVYTSSAAADINAGAKNLSTSSPEDTKVNLERGSASPVGRNDFGANEPSGPAEHNAKPLAPTDEAGMRWSVEPDAPKTSSAPEHAPKVGARSLPADQIDRSFSSGEKVVFEGKAGTTKEWKIKKMGKDVIFGERTATLSSVDGETKVVSIDDLAKKNVKLPGYQVGDRLHIKAKDGGLPDWTIEKIDEGHLTVARDNPSGVKITRTMTPLEAATDAVHVPKGSTIDGVLSDYEKKTANETSLKTTGAERRDALKLRTTALGERTQTKADKLTGARGGGDSTEVKPKVAASNVADSKVKAANLSESDKLIKKPKATIISDESPGVDRSSRVNLSGDTAEKPARRSIFGNRGQSTPKPIAATDTKLGSLQTQWQDLEADKKYAKEHGLAQDEGFATEMENRQNNLIKRTRAAGIKVEAGKPDFTNTSSVATKQSDLRTQWQDLEADKKYAKEHGLNGDQTVAEDLQRRQDNLVRRARASGVPVKDGSPDFAEPKSRLTSATDTLKERGSKAVSSLSDAGTKVKTKVIELAPERSKGSVAGDSVGLGAANGLESDAKGLSSVGKAVKVAKVAGKVLGTAGDVGMVVAGGYMAGKKVYETDKQTVHDLKHGNLSNLPQDLANQAALPVTATAAVAKGMIIDPGHQAITTEAAGVSRKTSVAGQLVDIGDNHTPAKTLTALQKGMGPGWKEVDNNTSSGTDAKFVRQLYDSHGKPSGTQVVEDGTFTMTQTGGGSPYKDPVVQKRIAENDKLTHKIFTPANPGGMASVNNPSSYLKPKGVSHDKPKVAGLTQDQTLPENVTTGQLKGWGWKETKNNEWHKNGNTLKIADDGGAVYTHNSNGKVVSQQVKVPEHTATHYTKEPKPVVAAHVDAETGAKVTHAVYKTKPTYKTITEKVPYTVTYYTKETDPRGDTPSSAHDDLMAKVHHSEAMSHLVKHTKVEYRDTQKTVQVSPGGTYVSTPTAAVVPPPPPRPLEVSSTRPTDWKSKGAEDLQDRQTGQTVIINGHTYHNVVVNTFKDGSKTVQLDGKTIGYDELPNGSARSEPTTKSKPPVTADTTTSKATGNDAPQGELKVDHKPQHVTQAKPKSTFDATNLVSEHGAGQMGNPTRGSDSLHARSAPVFVSEHGSGMGYGDTTPTATMHAPNHTVAEAKSQDMMGESPAAAPVWTPTAQIGDTGPGAKVDLSAHGTSLAVRDNADGTKAILQMSDGTYQTVDKSTGAVAGAGTWGNGQGGGVAVNGIGNDPVTAAQIRQTDIANKESDLMATAPSAPTPAPKPTFNPPSFATAQAKSEDMFAQAPVVTPPPPQPNSSSVVDMGGEDFARHGGNPVSTSTPAPPTIKPKLTLPNTSPHDLPLGGGFGGLDPASGAHKYLGRH